MTHTTTSHTPMSPWLAIRFMADRMAEALLRVALAPPDSPERERATRKYLRRSRALDRLLNATRDHHAGAGR